MESKPTTTSTNTVAAADQRPATRYYKQYDNQEQRPDRPFRPRGEGRGNYRGRNQDGAYEEGERPYRGGRGRGGRGRGGLKDGQNENDENTENAVTSSDNFYKQRPSYNREGGDTPYRGRGEGRGGRGGRGFRGGYNNNHWEEARPIQQHELKDDEEVVDVTEEQMDFINTWKAYGRKFIKILSDEQIVRVCIDFDFDSAKISEHLKKYETDDKYKGLAEFEWNQTQTRKEKDDERRKRKEQAEREKLRREAWAAKAQERAEYQARKAERDERLKQRNEKKEALAKERADRKAQKEEAHEVAEVETSEAIVETPAESTVEQVKVTTSAESVVEVTADATQQNEKSDKPKREKKERKPKEDKKAGKVVYRPKSKEGEEAQTAGGPSETPVAVAEPVQAHVEPAVVNEQPVAAPVEKHEEKHVETKKKPAAKYEPKSHAKTEEKVETPQPVVQAAPQVQQAAPQIPILPQMPGMMPMMPGMMPGMMGGMVPGMMAPTNVDGSQLTLEQQNLYNQQLIIMQQHAIQQYHQQLMQFYVMQSQQQAAFGQTGAPMMPMMFGMPGGFGQVPATTTPQQTPKN